jgi:hypothetical protein
MNNNNNNNNNGKWLFWILRLFFMKDIYV